jgi:hypothetical protein
MSISKKIVKKPNKPKTDKAAVKERLIIKNFGPISNFDMEVRKVNVLIGPSSTGKSVVAKLLSIFKEKKFLKDPSLKGFSDLLVHYNIPFELTSSTEIIFYSELNFKWVLKNHKIEHNWPFVDELFGIFEILVHSHQKSIDINEPKNDIESTTVIILMLGFILTKLVPDSKENLKITKPENLIPTKRKERNPYYNDLVTEIEKMYTIDNKSGNNNSDLFWSKIQKAFSKINKSLHLSLPVYIPAERIFLSMVGETIYSLIGEKVNLAPCFTNFAQSFITARKTINSLSIPELNANYLFSELRGNEILLSDQKRVKLEHASSGFQSLVPLKVVLNGLSFEEKTSFVVIEEPEINLYPTAQKQLLEEIVSFANGGKHQVCITTHSPYVISTVDNFLKAGHISAAMPNQKSKIKKIVTETAWIDPKDISCYYLDNGKGKNIIDQKLMMIDHNHIDDVSNSLGKIHDKLLDIQYG